MRPLSMCLAAILVLGPTPRLGAAELKPATLAAFDHYVQVTEVRMAAETEGAAPFLWIDRQPTPDRARAAAALQQGQVLVERLETREAGKAIDIPDGLVHHWIGTVFLPGVPLARVLAFVQDYDGYPRTFGPMIPRAHVVSQVGGHVDVAMRTAMHQVITVVIDADYAVDYRAIDPARVCATSVASRIREVSNAGTPDESSRPAATGGGYLWRLNTYCRFEARADGTYEQCESISLSRGLPFGIGWMVAPFVTSVPREALAFMLGHVRAALVK